MLLFPSKALSPSRRKEQPLNRVSSLTDLSRSTQPAISACACVHAADGTRGGTGVSEHVVPRTSSFDLKRVPVKRVEEYLQHKTVEVPTPEQCRQHFTADGMHNVLADLEKNGFSVVPGWFQLPDDDNDGVMKTRMTEEPIFERIGLVPKPTGVAYSTHRGCGKRLQTKKRHSGWDAA